MSENLYKGLADHYKKLAEQKENTIQFYSSLYKENEIKILNMKKELSNLNNAYLRLLKRYNKLKKQYKLDFDEPKV